MCRISATEVNSIINHSVDNVQPFIATAHTLIDEKLAGKGMSADLLKQIELWLAAHILAVTLARQAKSESVGGEYSVTYAGVFGEGLKSTTYGQMVLPLDNTGELAKASTPKVGLNV